MCVIEFQSISSAIASFSSTDDRLAFDLDLEFRSSLDWFRSQHAAVSRPKSRRRNAREPRCEITIGGREAARIGGHRTSRAGSAINAAAARFAMA